MLWFIRFPTLTTGRAGQYEVLSGLDPDYQSNAETNQLGLTLNINCQCYGLVLHF